MRTDPYAGLKGHNYIAARGLTPRSTHKAPACKHCSHAENLPAILSIIAAHKRRAAA